MHMKKVFGFGSWFQIMINKDIHRDSYTLGYWFAGVDISGRHMDIHILDNWLDPPVPGI